MEMASRQQQWMMDHPQDAARMMQHNAQIGESFASDEHSLRPIIFASVVFACVN